MTMPQREHRNDPEWNGAEPTAAPLVTFLAGAARVLRAIAGIPDYDRYVAHMRVRDPGTAPMSVGEFIAERQRERFEKPGGRCC